MTKLLLLSNSTMPGTSFFTWPKIHVQEFLGSDAQEVAFIPYAAVNLSYDAYSDLVAKALEPLGYRVKSVHSVDNKRGLIKDADAILVGGGNTFAVLARVYEQGLLKVLQSEVNAGKPYIGWSAGANLACPTLKTTNDMPVVMPRSFDALNLVPFQINPHYHELKFQNQGGETRRERIEEFLIMNPDKKVVGLPEGMLISRLDGTLKIVGDGAAKLFESGKSVRDLRGGMDISFLLG
jgi:dipeptidase E